MKAFLASLCILVMFFLCETIAFAERPKVDFNCPSSGVSTYIFYANGMFTTKDKAISNGDKLGLAMRKTGTWEKIAKPGETTALCVAYNFDEGKAAQLAEVLWQKAQDTAISNVELARRSRATLLKLFVRDKLPRSFFEKEDDRVAALMSPTNNHRDEDLVKHASLYRDRVATSASVIVVSHSQGNFYSNAAYSLMNTGERKRIGQVMVATPTKEVLSGGPYTTLTTDIVMNAVHKLFPLDTLPANFKAPVDPIDTTGHGFEESYLRYVPSRDKIMADIVKVAESLRTGAQVAEQLTIKVEPATPGNGTYSLYVYEPGGRQVYYQDRESKLGIWTTGGDEQTRWDQYQTKDAFGYGTVLQIGVFYANSERAPGRAKITITAGDFRYTGEMEFLAPDPLSLMLKPTLFGYVKAPTEKNAGEGIIVKPAEN